VGNKHGTQADWTEIDRHNSSSGRTSCSNSSCVFLRPVVCNAESAFFCDFLNVMQQKIDYSICAEQSDYYSLDDKPAIRCLY